MPENFNISGFLANSGDPMWKQQNKESAGKPGSVLDNHSSRVHVTMHL